MKRLIALSSLACMACTTVEAQNPAPLPDEAGCTIERLDPLVGRARSEALGAEARRLSGASLLRWISPGDMVTMDYQTGRLNIHLDAQGRVDRFACG